MIWFIPWALAATSWPATYYFTSNPSIATGVALILYGGAIVVGGVLKW